MKKLLPLVLAICLLIACQPTPDEPVVVQKDTERLVDTVIAQNNSENKQENTEDAYIPIEPITERFTYDYTSENGLLHITADADVSVPASGKIPMTHVQVTGFTDEFAKRVFDYVYQGKTVYMRVYSPRTKAMISEELKKYQEIANNGTWEENGFVDAQEVEEYIEQLKELYQSAPDELEPIKREIADGSMIVENYYGTDEYKLEVEDEAAYLEIRRNELANRNRTLTGSILYYTRGTLDESIGYEESGDGQRAFQNWYSEYDSYIVDTSDDTIAYGQTYSPKAAVQLGLQFFRDIGIEDVAQRDVSYLYVAHPNGMTKSMYLIEYVRTVEGTPVAFVPLTQAYGDPHSVELPWTYESIRVIVDDEGLKSVSWQLPIHVTDVVSDHVNVLSFEDAKSIFTSMCGIVYEPQTVTSFDADCYIDVKVEHVELSLIRIREQNAETNLTGLYVPAWLFYGKEVVQYKEHDEPDFSKPFTHILFAINAIDGSIIDLNKGY